jgi:hypothetical protein
MTGPSTLRSCAALDALKALLDEQRDALVSGRVDALEAANARLRTLLADPAWQRDAARTPRALGGLLAAANLNAGLAARGDAQVARTLAMLGATPGLYTAAGGLGAQGARHRGVAA